MFAIFALLLEAAGLYGLLSFSVTQRTGEIGIRIAIGASSSSVLSLILGRGMALAAAGVAAGVLASLGLARLLSTLVFDVGLTDPATFLTGAAILLLVALIASYVPARRATHLNPVNALRGE